MQTHTNNLSERMPNYKARLKRLLDADKPRISSAVLHEEAMHLLEKMRPAKDKDALREYTRLVLTASDLFSTIDKQKRDALLRELAKGIMRGEKAMASKDAEKVLHSGKELLEPLQKGNYAVTIVDGIVTYSYWDYAYISLNTRTREIMMLRQPEIKTAVVFVKYILEGYGLVYEKGATFYKLPERVA